MAQALPLIQRRFGDTTRRDFWWLQPLAVFLALSAFVVYATWAAFQGNHYEYGSYLSPFYSPLLFGEGPHAWFGPKPAWWPGALPFSAALLMATRCPPNATAAASTLCQDPGPSVST